MYRHGHAISDALSSMAECVKLSALIFDFFALVHPDTRSRTGSLAVRAARFGP